MTALFTSRNLLIACTISILCSGCFKNDRLESPDDGGSGNPPPAANQAPTISGSPMTALRVGEAYNFRPNASDPDGDSLTFSIENQPDWANFSSTNGRLTGTPSAADVGQFSNVRITVSDGRAQATLGAFSIAVNQVALGSVTLSWTPPTTNEDGSTITDLAGYRIYYGRSANTLDQSVAIDNAGMTRWVIENLSSATWFFSMTSVDASGTESDRSTVVSRTLT